MDAHVLLALLVNKDDEAGMEERSEGSRWGRRSKGGVRVGGQAGARKQEWGLRGSLGGSGGVSTPVQLIAIEGQIGAPL
ncbi:hypothetical protein O3P69_013790 [Scylla paramamosain]|uniref:Uncharacterized protein n=1 Tax=Scylla paramamosain TaxID=85552 RepID=A0AAW0SQX7_SCYPA